jgi:H+/Cl- antiporter ClcA
VSRRKNLSETWRRARHAWAFTLFGITVAAATVHLWNALFVLFLFLIGSGAWLYDVKPENRPSPLERIGGPLRLHRAAPRLRPSLGRLF